MVNWINKILFQLLLEKHKKILKRTVFADLSYKIIFSATVLASTFNNDDRDYIFLIENIVWIF